MFTRKDVSLVFTWICVGQLGLICGIEAVFIAVLAGTKPFDMAYNHPSPGIHGLATALYPVFATIGCLIVTFCVARIRPSTLIIVGAYVWLVGYLVAVLVPHLAGLLAARMLKGVSVGIFTAVLPLYVQRLQIGSQGAMLLILFQTTVPLGLVITSALAVFVYAKPLSEISFQNLWVLAGIPAFPVVITCLLARKEDNDDATSDTKSDKSKRSELSASPVAPVNKPLSVLEELKSIVFNKRHRNRTLLAAFVQICVQLTGVNVLLYYIKDICRLIGFSEDTSSYISLGLYISNFVGTGLSILFINRISHRKALGYCALALEILYGILATALTYGQIYRYGVAMSPVCGYVALAACFGHMTIFSLLFAGVSYVYTSELVDPQVGNSSMGLAIAAGWIANSVLSGISPILFASIGIYTFSIFMWFCAVMYVAFFNMGGMSARPVARAN